MMFPVPNEVLGLPTSGNQEVAQECLFWPAASSQGIKQFSKTFPVLWNHLHRRCADREPLGPLPQKEEADVNSNSNRAHQPLE